MTFKITVVLRISGRIDAEQLSELRACVLKHGPGVVLDLGEVQLVDVAAVRFLAQCDTAEMELRNCARYIREWMDRERPGAERGDNVADKTTMKPAFRTADGVRIRYAEAGRGAGETVVLTCPWPESLFAFRKVWGRLAQRFHVIAIDLPGFGQSDRRLDLYAPKAMGAFLVKLINEWQLGPVHLVGPDVGTSAQLWAAATNPKLVRSLVIGGGAMALPLQTGGALKTIIEAPNMDWVTDSAQTLGPVYDAIPGGTAPEIKADYLASYAGDRFAESARYVRSYPAELPLLAKVLPTILTPVLLMSGAKDELVPLVNAEFVHERLPNSRMGMLQAGHFAWEEVSDQYADGLLEWIGGGYRRLSLQEES